MSRKIKKSQILELARLKGKAKILSMAQEKLVQDALKITGEKNEAGYTFDFLLNDYGSLQDLLDKLGLEQV